LFVVLAGGEGQAQAPDVGVERRRSAGAPDRAHRVAGDETIEKRRTAAQAAHFDPHAVGVLGQGLHLAAPDAGRKGLVVGQFPAQRDRRIGQAAAGLVRLRRQTGPQHDGVGPRHAARDAERERIDAPAEGVRRCGSQRWRPHARQRDQRGAATDVDAGKTGLWGQRHPMNCGWRATFR
jgi:hypothetical protein